jgi:hypothetical protein
MAIRPYAFASGSVLARRRRSSHSLMRFSQPRWATRRDRALALSWAELKLGPYEGCLRMRQAQSGWPPLSGGHRDLHDEVPGYGDLPPFSRMTSMTNSMDSLVLAIASSRVSP